MNSDVLHLSLSKKFISLAYSGLTSSLGVNTTEEAPVFKTPFYEGSGDSKLCETGLSKTELATLFRFGCTLL